MNPQFFLLSSEIDDPLAFRPKLEAALSTGAFSVALLRFGAETEADLKRKAMALKTLVQEAECACLIDFPEEPRLVARLGLDGAHVSSSGSRVDEAIEALKPDRIVGVGGLKSRHDAMEAGEKDIDYVMFGEPRADGFVPPLAQTIERAEWWASIFIPPCVAYASDLDAVAALSKTGTEFIALGPWIFEADDPAALVAEARRIAKAKGHPIA